MEDRLLDNARPRFPASSGGERVVLERCHGWQGFELSPALGVEITGLDLRRPLGADEISALRRLFDEHGLLLVRDQAISESDQLRVCRHLRPVADPIAWISNVEPGFHPEGELWFHSDYAFTAHPMLGLSLFTKTVGAAPGAISIANSDSPSRGWAVKA